MYNNYRAYSSRNIYSNSRYNNINTNTKQKFKNNFTRTNFNNSKKIKVDEINKTDTDANNNTPLFNILGFDIYFDDFLLLSILIFLYKENIKDDYLFITLILLLLN